MCEIFQIDYISLLSICNLLITRFIENYVLGDKIFITKTC